MPLAHVNADRLGDSGCWTKTWWELGYYVFWDEKAKPRAYAICFVDPGPVGFYHTPPFARRRTVSDVNKWMIRHGRKWR
jgi:hypothetical protein